MIGRRVTLAAVNAALEAAGLDERLDRARDYFFFYAGEASAWESSMVEVAQLGALSIEQWVAIAQERAAVLAERRAGRVPVMMTCATCDGRGHVPAVALGAPCSTCNGSGAVRA